MCLGLYAHQQPKFNQTYRRCVICYLLFVSGRCRICDACGPVIKISSGPVLIAYIAADISG